MPQILPICLTLLFRDRIRTKTNTCKALRSTESLFQAFKSLNLALVDLVVQGLLLQPLQ